MKKVFRKTVSITLSAVMLITSLPLHSVAMAANAGKPEAIQTGDGTVEVTDDWETTFPYGTFAFDTSEATLEEGGDTLVVNVYRLGGSKDRATAVVRYSPAILPTGEDEVGYANAVSTDDLILEVEEASPIAKYQPVGKLPDPEVGIAAIRQTEDGEDIILSLDMPVDSCQWQSNAGSRWKDVEEATEETFTVGKEDLEMFDFRCVYVIDGVTFCTSSAKGEAYEKAEEEALPKMPDDLDLNPEQSFTKLVPDEKDPYLAYDLYLTFADGEWMKSIRITAPEDNLAECLEHGLLVIADCEGGSVYDTANTLIFAVVDNDDPEPFEIGIVDTDVAADKADGTATVTLRRTGGNQTMVAVTYETADGTAVKGKDYEAASGEVSFYGDAREQVIEIPLIDDGKADDEEKTFSLNLTGLKGDSKGLGTLTETAATVRLTNSGTGSGANLATMLVEPEAIDLSEQTQTAAKSVVDVDPETVTGSQPDAPEPVIADIASLGGGGGGPLKSYDYGRVTFNRFDDDYSDHYWTSYYDVLKAGLNWSNGQMDDKGWILKSNTNKTAVLNLDYMAQKYSSFYGLYDYNAEWASQWTLIVFDTEFVYPWAAVRTSTDNNYAYTDCEYSLNGSTLNYKTSGFLRTEWPMDSGVSKLVLGLSQYDAHDSDKDAYCRITDGDLTRREFRYDLHLVVHTSNDGESGGRNVRTAPDGAAELTASSGVYDSMKPTISLVEGESGVNWGGMLYVGSKLRVSLNKTVSYFPYNKGELSAAIYLTRADGSIVNAKIEREQGDDYLITLVWDGMTEDDLEDIYTINVVMNREQKLNVNLTPSVEHFMDDEGNVLASIDPSKIGDAEDLFWNSGKSYISYGYSEHTNKAPHYKAAVSEDKISRYSGSNNRNFSLDDAVMNYNGTFQNLQWINLNRDPEDRILFNGRLFNGDETIWLTTADLALGTLNVYYYNKAYLSETSVMSAKIDAVGLYWDGDANGQIDGEYNTATGYFDIAEGSQDEFLQYLTPDTDYTEAIFNYTKNQDGELGEMYLKIFYTMTPRAISPKPGEEDERAQIIPALTTSVTDPDVYASLTDEQQLYRYLYTGKDGNGDYTSDDHPMYGAPATALQYVDVPLGGDRSPVEPVMVDGKQKYTWEPDYQGNLLFFFNDPDPIFIEHSLAGDNIPLAPSAQIEDGEVSMSEEDIANINGYLGSFLGSSSIALCVQQQLGDMDEIVKDPESLFPNPESSELVSNNSTPDSGYLSQLGSGDEPAEGGFDMDESGSDLSEFNVDLNSKIPKLNFGATEHDFISYSYNGLEHIISFCIPLTTWKQGKGWTGPVDSIKSKAKKFEYCKNIYFGPQGVLLCDDGYSNAVEKGKYTSKGFNGYINFIGAVYFKYDPVENEFIFKQFALGATGSFRYTYTHRFTFCPLIYLTIKVGVSLEITSGGHFKPNKVESVPLVGKGGQHETLTIQQGKYYVFPIKYKSLTLKFKGKLGLELYEDAECTRKVNSANIGFLKSDGKKEITATMLRKDGYGLDGKTYYLKVSGMENSQVTHLATIEGQKYEIFWNGFHVDPGAFLAVACGIGAEMLKFELSVKLSAAVAMKFYEEGGDDFFLDSVKFAIALSFKIVLLFFSDGMDLIGYSINYDGEKDRWTHNWSALGGKYGGEIGELSAKKSASRSLGTLEMEDAAGNRYDARLKLPGNTSGTQTVYKQQEGAGSQSLLKAYKPTDVNVPFELGGYSASSDAAKLVDGLITGYDYQVVTIGEDNYVLFTIGRDDAKYATDNSILVMSKLKMTGLTPGLVNPVDEEADVPYIVVDLLADGSPDKTGDLAFNAEARDGVLFVSWVSYDQVTGQMSQNTRKELDFAAKNTVIKTAVFKPGDKAFSPAATVSGDAGANVSAPTVASNAVVFVRSRHLTEEELDQRTEILAGYLAKQGFDVDSEDEARAEIAESRISIQRAKWTVTGGSSNLCVSVYGAEAAAIALPEGVTVDNIEAEKIGDKYYVVYTTSETIYTDEQGARTEDAQNISNMLTIKRLYLRSFTVSDGEVTWGQEGKAVLLRTLYDYDNNDNLMDGVYQNGVRTESKDDPWFSNLKFLTANLGGVIQGEEEQFPLRSAQDEHFLVFEMNGATYLIREDSVKSIAEAQGGAIIPFFEADTANADERAKSSVATGRSHTTIGVAGDGSLAAVYTAGVDNSSDNALWLAKYDPATGSWGSGTILAMNHLSVYEDNIKESRNSEDAQMAYFGLLPEGKGGSLDSFTFVNPQIAFGSTTDTLLVLTQGTMGYYKENPDNEEYPVIAIADSEVTAEDYPRSQYARPGVGVYAIGYGIGQQKIADAYLRMQWYDFSAGADPIAEVGFTNTGDVGIRGSEDQPIEVTLIATNDGTVNELAHWTVTENIVSGQDVELHGELYIPETLSPGTELAVRVSESEAYAESGGKPYSAVTDTLLTVISRPELSVISDSVSPKSVDDEGRAIIDVDFLAGNRGMESAENVLAVFSYDTGFRDEDDNVIWAPLNLSDADLRVEDEKLERSSTLKKSGEGGKSEGVFELGSIAPGYGKRVTGNIPVPSSCFNDIATGGLSLQVELFSEGDEMNVSDMGVLEGTHDEYNVIDNKMSAAVEHSVLFSAPAKIMIPMGNTVRIPIIARYTMGDTTPRILVTEFADKESEAPEGEMHLGIKSFRNGVFEDGFGRGTLVLAPSSEGSGYVRILDTVTNSFYDIAYSVSPTVDGINIFNNNDWFRFYNADGTEYDGTAAASAQSWAFDSLVPVWGLDSSEPYLGDLAMGEAGSSFTFVTEAEAISLIFNGTVRVESDFAGFEPVEISASGGSGDGDGEQEIVVFGFNPENRSHTVTITVVSAAEGTKYASFDRLIEHFSEQGGVPVPAKDDDDPHIFYSRSFPPVASVEEGAELPLKAYILDNTGLASVVLNGKTPSALTKVNDAFWVLDLKMTENGTYTIDVVDDAGNRTVHELEVDWFNVQTTHDTSAAVPQVEAVLMKREDGEGQDVELTADTPFVAGDSAYLKIFAKDSKEEDKAELMVTYIADGPEGGLESTVISPSADGTYPVNRNGGYLVRAFDPVPFDYRWAQTMVFMDRYDVWALTATLTLKDDGQTLEWHADKQTGGSLNVTIDSVTINGLPLAVEAGQKSLSGDFALTHNGDYTLTVRDTAGNTATADCRVTGIPVGLADGKEADDLLTVNNVGHTTKGRVEIHPSVLVGGYYDPAVSTPAEGSYAGSYEFALLPYDKDVSIPEQIADAVWTADTVYEDLESGVYLVLARDTQDRDDADAIAVFQANVGEDHFEHEWGEWINDEETGISCTHGGTQHRVCAVCGKKETQVVIGGLGHKVKNPNLLGEGYCKNCGEFRCCKCAYYEKREQLPLIGLVYKILHRTTHQSHEKLYLLFRHVWERED